MTTATDVLTDPAAAARAAHAAHSSPAGGRDLEWMRLYLGPL